MFGKTKNLRNYWKNHWLMVVDMQWYYLEKSDPDLADKIPVLIKMVSLHIISCLSHGWRIIIVETDWAWDTQDILGQQIKRQTRYDILRKTKDSALSEECPHKKTNEKLLKSHGMPTRFSVTGVNTLACVRKTSNALVDIWLDVSLVPGATINTDCSDHNLFECLEHYKWAKGVLRDFKIGKNEAKSLTDYL